MAKFTKPMEWNNKGIEPSETLKNQGFKGGYKPPAEIFNYFLNNSKTCITELQTAVNGLLKDALLSGSKLTFTKNNGETISIIFENATATKDGQMSSTDKKNLDSLVGNSFTDVSLNSETMRITFSRQGNGQSKIINIKDTEHSKAISALDTKVDALAISKANTGKLTLSDSTATYNVTCGFEPRYIKIYGAESGTVLIYNEKILYSGPITKVTTTSNGFSFTKMNIGTSLEVFWEAYA